MATEIITQEDLERFGDKLTETLKSIIEENRQPKKVQEEEVRLLKSHQVQRMLGISPGTLQNLRINGTLPYSKIGGVIFYDKQEILKLLEINKRNIL